MNMNGEELEVNGQVEDVQIEDTLPEHYIFSPSVTKTRTINGKTYIVRSYFAGKKDFAKVMTQLAIRQAYKHTENK